MMGVFFRELFPVTERWAYLNHASSGPLSAPVLAAVTEFVCGQAEGGSRFLEGAWQPRYRETKQLMARLLNASPDEVAVVKNVAEAVSTVASGLDWQPGENVVTTALEFPANVYPWLNLGSRGVETRGCWR